MKFFLFLYFLVAFYGVGACYVGIRILAALWYRDLDFSVFAVLVGVGMTGSSFFCVYVIYVFGKQFER